MHYSFSKLRSNRNLVAILSTSIIAISAFLLNFDASTPAYSDWPDNIVVHIQYLQKYSLVTLIIAVFLSLIHQWLSGKSNSWPIIHSFLGYIRNKVFKDTNGDPKHYHRVTLFEFKKYVWKWGYFIESIKNIPSRNLNGWLIPVCRAGHLTQKSHAIFRVEDTGRHEGVCGMSWSACEIKVLNNLPRVEKNSNDIIVSKYAEVTGCNIESLRTRIIRTSLSNSDEKDITLPRSIGAIPVGPELQGGAPRYVLVLDSRNKGMIPEDIGNQYSVVLKVLSHLLEEGG
ncbi:MAG: hypothetical protein ACPGGD_08565 [Thalassolituus sp.]|jgi:hypothetical protein